MQKFSAFVGLDVHKDSISVAVAEAERGEVRLLGSVPNTVDAVNRLVRRVIDRFGHVEFVQEAGPCGYGLHCYLERLGETSRVVAPSRTPKRSGDRIKNDTRDALMLARLLRAGELEFIWVPDRVHEAVRDSCARGKPHSSTFERLASASSPFCSNTIGAMPRSLGAAPIVFGLPTRA